MAAALLDEEVLDSKALMELLGPPPHGAYVEMSEGLRLRPTESSADGVEAGDQDGSSSESAATDDSSETPEKTAP
jgi:hypothetical protein